MIGHQAHPLRICDIIILFCLVPVVGLAQNISISDFRIPESKWQYFFGNLQGSFNMGNFDRQENYGTPIFHFRDESNNEVLLGAQGNYSFVHLNEEYSHEIYLDLNSRHGYSRNEVTDRDTALRYQDKRKGITEYAEMRPFWRYSSYIQPDFFYAFGSLEGRLMYSLYKNSYESFPGYLPQDYTSKNRLYSVTVSAGFGLGKIRDGRPVFRVLRYLDKIIADSSLTRPLESEEILRLVALFAKQSQYSAEQERYSKFFLRDVLWELQSMGVLRGGRLEAYEVLRGEEVLGESILPRIFGWRLEIGFERNNFQDEYQSTTGSTIHNRNTRNFIVPRAEFGHDLSLTTHFYASAGTRFSFLDGGNLQDLHTTTSVIHELDEMIEFITTFSYLKGNNIVSYSWQEAVNEKAEEYGANVAFRFFIENEITFQVGLGYFDRWNERTNPSSILKYSYNSFNGNFSIRYRFF